MSDYIDTDIEISSDDDDVSSGRRRIPLRRRNAIHRTPSPLRRLERQNAVVEETVIDHGTVPFETDSQLEAALNDILAEHDGIDVDALLGMSPVAPVTLSPPMIDLVTDQERSPSDCDRALGFFDGASGNCNVRVSAPRSAAKHWVFTLNLRDRDYYPVIPSPWYNECTYFIVGKEVAPTTGTKHYQGYFTLEKKMCFQTVRKMFLPDKPYLAVMRSRPIQASAYCKKGGDFFEIGVLGEGDAIFRWQDVRKNAAEGNFDQIPDSVFVPYYNNIHRIFADAAPPVARLTEYQAFGSGALPVLVNHVKLVRIGLMVCMLRIRTSGLMVSIFESIRTSLLMMPIRFIVRPWHTTSRLGSISTHSSLRLKEVISP